MKAPWLKSRVAIKSKGVMITLITIALAVLETKGVITDDF